MTVSHKRNPGEPPHRLSDVELMLYADGELDPTQARAAAAWLAEDSDARAKVEAMRQVGEAVRTYTELETDRAEAEVPAFAELWSRIERRISANGAAAGVGAAAAVTDSLAPAPRARAAGEGAGLWASVRRWFEDHRGYVVTGVVSAGAVAALMLAIGPRERVVREAVRKGGGSVGVGTPAVLRSQPPEVEDLEVYGGSGTILTIEPDGADDSAAAVIWISSDDEENREGPL